MRLPVPLVVSKDEELRRLMVEGDKDEYKRCLAIILRARGMHPKDIAETLGVTRRSLERWVKAYRTHGVAGLSSRKRPGRRRRIGEAERRLIAEIALKSPRIFGYLKNEWSVRLLSRHLTEELRIRISVTHTWRILRDLGIVYKKPKAVVKSPIQNMRRKPVLWRIIRGQPRSS